MKILFAVVLLTSCLPNLAKNIIVQDGDYTFPFKDVKELWDLMDVDTDISDDNIPIFALCKNPKLPGVFKSVCGSSDAPQVFHRLMELAVKADVCEICAYAACSGC